MKSLPKSEVVSRNFKYIHRVNLNSFEKNDSKIIFTRTPTFDIKEISSYVIEEKFDNTKLKTVGGTGSYSYNADSVSIIDGKNLFKPEMKGGKIIFPFISKQMFPSGSRQGAYSQFESTIASFRAPARITLEDRLFVTSSFGGDRGLLKPVTSIQQQQYIIKYNDSAKQRIITENLKPYAKIDITNLDVDTGKITRVKVYTKSSFRPSSEFELAYDGEVYPRNILVESSNNIIENPLGVFDGKITLTNSGSTTTSSIDPVNYWRVESINGAPGATKVTSSAYVPNGIQLSPVSNVSGLQDHLLVQTSSYVTTFVANSVYNLSFNYSLANPQFDTRPQKIAVYISGSAFVNNTPYGKYLADVPSPTINGATVFNHSISMVPNSGGNGVLKFLMRDNATISDISIKEKLDLGFSRVTLPPK